MTTTEVGLRRSNAGRDREVRVASDGADLKGARKNPGLAFDRSVRPIQSFWVLDIAQHCSCSCE